MVKSLTVNYLFSILNAQIKCTGCKSCPDCLTVFLPGSLGKRAVLLQQMEICFEEQKAKKKHQATIAQAARERNSKILAVF